MLFRTLSILILLKINLLEAQTTPTRLLTLEDFLNQTRQNHPTARQANLLREQAEAELFKSKGGFDPKLFGDHDSKFFKNKTYFSRGEYGLKVPTWAGLELKTGFSTASGNFLNPENTLPAAGQAIAGFDWTLGRGLLFDERRADLFSARAGIRLAEAERKNALNDLLFEASKNYWAWAVARNQVEVFGQALLRARERFDGIRESLRQGDKPAIDTLEALILVQTRLFDLNDARQEARAMDFFLKNFIWKTPLEPADGRDSLLAPTLPFNFFPEKTSPEKLAELEKQLLENHPTLTATKTKMEQIGIERRLKRENRKPQLDLSYNLLADGYQFFPEQTGVNDLLGNNLKFGIGFSYPLPNRKARGDLQKTELKLTSTEAALAQKQQDLLTKLRFYAAEANNLAEQIRLFSSIVENQRRLLEGEQEKFRIGESSLFLLNSREQKLLETQVKLLKLVGEFEKTQVAVLWAAGLLGG